MPSFRVAGVTAGQASNRPNGSTGMATILGHAGQPMSATFIESQLVPLAVGGSKVVLPDVVAVATISGSGATTQAAQTEAGSGKLRFIASGTDAQAAQTATSAGKLRFGGTGASAQAGQAESGAGRLDFRASGASSQAAQSAAATARERFTSSGATAQAAQAASGAGRSRFIAAGASTQAAQTATGSGIERFRASGAPVQAGQTATGAGHTPSTGVSGTGASLQTTQTASGAGVLTNPVLAAVTPGQMAPRNWGAQVSGPAQARIYAPRIPEPLRITGQGASTQRPQRAYGRGVVTNEEELLLLAA